MEGQVVKRGKNVMKANIQRKTYVLKKVNSWQNAVLYRGITLENRGELKSGGMVQVKIRTSCKHL